MTATLQRVQFVHGINAPRDQVYDNIRANIATARNKGCEVFAGARAILVGGGPSAADHLEAIRASTAPIWALNGAHDWLIGHGIMPAVCVVMDSNEVVNSFVKSTRGAVRYMVASQTHPSLMQRLVESGCQVVLWHAALDDMAHALMGEVTITAPANTVGLHALQLMALQGVRHATIYGMDSSHRPTAHHAYANDQQHAADEVSFVFMGKVYKATGTWAAQADLFRKMYPKFVRAGLRIDVMGDGLLPDMWRQAHNEFIRSILDGDGE